MPNRAAVRYSLVLLGLLIAVQIAINWLWLETNVVVLGMDRTFHQVTSLAYDNLLRDGVSLRSLFAALTWSDYYPPLVHLVIAGFYQLFGVSADVAAMANSLYLAVLLLAVWGIGERLAGPWAGLLAAFIVSLLPMVAAMSRYVYLDYALTALVAANVCLLLRSDHFRRRGLSLLYGLSLGLGLLVKWTFVVFAGGPLLAALLSLPGGLGALGAGVRAALDRRRLIVAALLGLGVTALWYVPNVAATAALPLGYGLPLLSWLLWTVTWAFVLAPRTPGLPSGPAASNLLAALGLGACVASGWYLTKVNFLPAFWLNAYGKSTGREWGFDQYLSLVVGEQLSPVLAALIVAALIGLAVGHYRRARAASPAGLTARRLLDLGLDGWALVLWVVVPYVVMSAQVSIVHSRYIMPLLPPLGIALAVALSRIRRRWLRGLAIAGVGAVALFQFAVLSFDALAGWQEAVPGLARGYSLQSPASGRTDPGYWVVPDILAYVEEHRDGDPARLGVLVNTQPINSKHFIYLVYADYPHVQIQELAELGQDKGLYGRLFDSDFVLLIDPPPSYARRPEARQTMERLLGTPDDTFHRAFALVQTYPLPSAAEAGVDAGEDRMSEALAGARSLRPGLASLGARLLLYQRRFPRPAETGGLEEGAAALMADLRRAVLPGDVVAVAPPGLVYAVARTADPAVQLIPLPPDDAEQVDRDLVARLGQEPGRVWLILGEGQAAPPVDGFYPAGQAWYGPLQLQLYAPPAGEPCQPRPSGAVWGEQIALTGYCFADDSLPPGQIARLDLAWQAEAPVEGRYKVFVHLLDAQGVVVSQHDAEPGAGARPTDSWPVGEPVADGHGLLLPADLPPGDYQVVVGLYPADGGDRLPVCCPASDAFVLAGVHVEDGVARFTPVPAPTD